MVKRIVTIIVSLSLVFSISTFATNSAGSTTTPSASEEIPMQRGGSRQGAEASSTEDLPQGDKSQNGEMPTMPEGEMPFGEGTPPQNNENATAGNIQQEQPQNGENAQGNATLENNPPRNGMMPGDRGEMQGNAQNAEAQSKTGVLGFIQTYFTPITSVFLLILAFVFVAFYKRKRY